MHRSPTPALLAGLVLTLGTVAGYSWYVIDQISGLQRLQRELIDRNRRDSFQLLRIQGDLHEIGLAMRDMVDDTSRYGVVAWSAQFEALRLDLEDALAREDALGLSAPTPEQREYLTSAFAQFWDAVDRVFELAMAGKDDDARAQIRLSLQARQSALSTAVARLLIGNNEREAQAAQQVQDIYGAVQRQAYWFLAATLTVIVLTSLYLIRANRQLFGRLATLSDERRTLAQTLIATREATLREISRELHDQLGQILTAIGSMVRRASAHLPETSPVRGDLREIGGVAQTALDSVRGLSQTLHPSLLEDLGLESAIEWYLSSIKGQLGVDAALQTSGASVPVDADKAIHVYRVLQEAISNVARHAGSDRATVRLAYAPQTVTLEIEDHGRGFDPRTARRGLGLVTMQERADIVGGRLEVRRADGGGTLVRLVVPL